MKKLIPIAVAALFLATAAFAQIQNQVPQQNPNPAMQQNQIPQQKSAMPQNQFPQSQSNSTLPQQNTQQNTFPQQNDINIPRDTTPVVKKDTSSLPKDTTPAVPVDTSRTNNRAAMENSRK